MTGDSARPLIVLYIGDWDASGLCMSERDLPKRLAEYGANVWLYRIADALPPPDLRARVRNAIAAYEQIRGAA